MRSSLPEGTALFRFGHHKLCFCFLFFLFQEDEMHEETDDDAEGHGSDDAGDAQLGSEDACGQDNR